MALEVVGSNPTTHPIFYNLREFLLWCRQEVKARDFDSRIVGSNPATPDRFDPLAQSVEHLTFKQGVRSSKLRRVTKLYLMVSGRGGIGSRAGFRLRCRREYEFESLRPHHFKVDFNMRE